MKVSTAVMNIKCSMNVKNVENVQNVHSVQTLTKCTNANRLMSVLTAKM